MNSNNADGISLRKKIERYVWEVNHFIGWFANQKSKCLAMNRRIWPRRFWWRKGYRVFYIHLRFHFVTCLWLYTSWLKYLRLAKIQGRIQKLYEENIPMFRLLKNSCGLHFLLHLLPIQDSLFQIMMFLFTAYIFFPFNSLYPLPLPYLFHYYSNYHKNTLELSWSKQMYKKCKKLKMIKSFLFPWNYKQRTWTGSKTNK